jgi:hypothetical protein
VHKYLLNHAFDNQERWLCDTDASYKPEDTKNLLKTLNDHIEKNDEKRCEELKNDINFLMVVVS